MLASSLLRCAAPREQASGDVAPVSPPRDATVEDFTLDIPAEDSTAGDRAPEAGPGVFLELGTGQNRWEPVAPAGSRMELVHGPQGGYHLLGRVRFQGFTPGVRADPATSGVNLAFQVTPIEGGSPYTDPGGLNRWEGSGLLRLPENVFESAFGELVILTVIRSPLEVVGRSFRLEVTLRENATGRRASASRDIVIVDLLP